MLANKPLSHSLVQPGLFTKALGRRLRRLYGAAARAAGGAGVVEER